MEINYLAILVCGILAMIVGFVWYGPLFGKKWLEVVGATALDLEKRKEMQKKAMPLYVTQFILVLFQVWVLAYFLQSAASSFISALWIWAGFVIPTVAGSCMWNNDSSKVKWTKFFIEGGYYLVLFVIFGLVLGMWQ